MNRKGMSQTLALIVAAMVLMMTALTLIFMTQGSLQDLFSGSERQSCVSTAAAKCSAGASSFTVSACEGVENAPNDASYSISGTTVECNGGSGGSGPPLPGGG